jgi:TolA-binding protein
MSGRHENRRHAREDRLHRSDGRRGHGAEGQHHRDRGRERGDERRRDRDREPGGGSDNERPGEAPAKARGALRDPKLASIFSVCGSYFVDVLFNHMYNAARPTGNSSITDEYRQNASAYMIGVKSDAQCYHTVVQNLHQYFVNHTRLTTMTFSDFVDKVVSCFVPGSYYVQMTAEEKDEILSSVICELVSGLVVYCTAADMLRRVIDARDTETAVTIRMMQEKAVAIQEQKRDAIHNDFLRQLGQPRETVPVHLVEKMKKALKQLAREKADEGARADEAEEEVGGLQDEVDDLREEVRRLRAREAKYRRALELLRNLQTPEGREELQRLQTQTRYDHIAERRPPPRTEDRGPPPSERIAENRGGKENGGPAEGRAKSPGGFTFKSAPLAALTTRKSLGSSGGPRGAAPGEPKTDNASQAHEGGGADEDMKIAWAD